MNKFIAYIFAALILFGIGAFIGIKLQKPAEVPTYTQADSIKLDSLENEIVKADDLINFHKSNAENLILEKNGLKKSNFILSEKLRKILVNPTAKCEDKLKISLFLNDSLQIELNKCDSAYMEVDAECENYAIQLDNYQAINIIEIKRNAAIYDSVSSLHVLYTDSLKLERKTIKKERSKTFFYKATTTVAAALGIYGLIK